MPFVCVLPHQADGCLGILSSQADDGVAIGKVHRIGISLRELLRMCHIYHRRHLYPLWHLPPTLIQMIAQADSGDATFIQKRGHLDNYQGWVNTMHGGILSTLIDEVCGWVVTRKLQTSGYTVQLNVKSKKAIPTTEPELTIRAKVSKQVRNLVYINAEITNSKGELCNEGEAIYFLMNQEKAKEMGFLHCEIEE